MIDKIEEGKKENLWFVRIHDLVFNSLGNKRSPHILVLIANSLLYSINPWRFVLCPFAMIGNPCISGSLGLCLTVTRVETKERECWKPDQRLTSENDSRFNGQPSIPSNIPRLWKKTAVRLILRDFYWINLQSYTVIKTTPSSPAITV